MINIQYLFSA